MVDLMLDKVMPQNTEAERAVLSAMFFDREAIYEVTQILKAEDFYRQDHAVLFQTIIELTEKGQPVDLITVTNRLQQEGNVEKAGGITYLAQINGESYTASNLVYYANIVKEKAMLRELIRVTTNLSNRGYQASEEADALLDDAERMIMELSQDKVRKGLTPISGVIDETIARLEYLYNKKDGLTGLTSGFVDLDKVTSGWQNSDFVIIAARPAMGKTAFCLNMAQNAAIESGRPVAVFSLEMSKEQLVQRMVSSAAELDQQKLRTGRLQEEDWATLVSAVGPLADAPIYLDDTPAVSVRDIRAKCRRLKVEKDLALVIIDYLQLMSGNGRSESRQQEVSQISRSLKALARELNVPIIALSQLSRSAEQSADKKPSLSHLRESGSLEQDADIVMFIHRDEYYNPDSEKKGIAEIIIAKHRNGATGTVELSFRKEFVKFGNLYRGD